MFISSKGSISPQQSSQQGMKLSSLSSLVSGGRSEQQTFPFFVLTKLNSSRQQGQEEWFRHHRTTHSQQNTCPHCNLPYSSAYSPMQIMHRYSFEGVELLMLFMRRVRRGWIYGRVRLLSGGGGLMWWTWTGREAVDCLERVGGAKRGRRRPFQYM